MIKFYPRKVDSANNNSPIISNREIDEFALKVLADYKPGLLREPGKLNYQHFLESYLGMCIEYHDIYCDDPKRPILAMTAFQRGTINVFDEENEDIETIVIEENTVILDNYLLKPGKEALALFTGFHEGGHIMLHRGVYVGYLSEDYEYIPDDGLSAVICCRRENVESFGAGKKERSAAEWREHQADYFAGAIAMPNATLIPFANGLLRENGYYKGAVTLGRSEDLDILAEDILPDAISDVYGVSKRAARIKLRKSGLVLPGKAVGYSL